MEEWTLILADNLLKFRLHSGLTQLELAEKLNYTDKLISKWERGESVPGTVTMKIIADLYGVKVDDFFTDRRSGDVPLPFNEEEPGVEQENEKREGEPSGNAGVRAKLPRPANKQLITLISVASLLLVALVVFVILWIVLNVPYFQIFVYVLPAVSTLYLVLNSALNHGKHNFIIIGLLLLSIILTLYVALLQFNCWQLFLLLIPGELIVWLVSVLKRKLKSPVE